MTFEEKLAELDDALTPAHFQEFQLGMFLTSLVDMIEYMDDNYDPDELDAIVDGAQVVLLAWKQKYQPYIDVVVGKKTNEK